MSTAIDIDLDEKGAPICVIGARWPLRFFVTTGEDIIVTADAALSATTISIRTRRSAGLTIALSSGAKIRFGNLIVTLSSSAAIGATSLAVTAISGALPATTYGKQVVDVTGYVTSFVVRQNESDTDAILTIAGALTDPTNGVVDVINPRAGSISGGVPTILAGSYYYAFSHTDSGFEALLASGGLQVYEKASR